MRSGPREAWSPGPSGSMRASVGEGTPATANGDTSMEASSPGMGLDDSFKGSPGASPLKGDDDGTRVQVICRVRPLIQYEIAVSPSRACTGVPQPRRTAAERACGTAATSSPRATSAHPTAPRAGR